MRTTVLLFFFVLFYQCATDEERTRNPKGCKKPKGKPGKIIYHGCTKFECVKMKKKFIWEESPADRKCCFIDNIGYPVGTIIFSNTTADDCSISSLACEIIGKTPSLRILIENTCSFCPATTTTTKATSKATENTAIMTKQRTRTITKTKTKTTTASTAELRGGSSPNQGNLFVNGKPVCDDYWDNNDAIVACRMLGFSFGTSTAYSTYGSVPDDFIMDDVNCDGSEKTLFDCSYNPNDNCGSREGAGVICTNSIMTTQRPRRTTKTKKTKTTTANTAELWGGSTPNQGNLFVNGKPVCDDYWDNNDAIVACRMLGYLFGTSTASSTYGSVPDDFIMDDVNCNGSEETLFDCSYNANHNCGSREGAGAICTNSKTTTMITSTTPTANTTELRGGSSPNQGNLFVNGKPVCDDYWDNNDAIVACRMLGYSFGTSTAYYTYGIVPDDFIMDDVNCDGSEKTLFDCSYNPKDNCGSREGAGVICTNSMATTKRTRTTLN